MARLSRTVKPRVLLVDDEPMLVRGLRLHLRKNYQVDTALSGEQALEKLAENPGYAVVVSDMRMPGMSGTELLSNVKKRSPNTWRVLLTGQADLSQVAAAVNEGHLFACLLKPCRPNELTQTIDAAVHARELSLNEQEMMRETLTGAVDMVTELLAMANPLAFGKARRMKVLVGHVASSLGLEAPWQFELAAMLSQIGCISVPANVLERRGDGERMSRAESLLLSDHPRVARQLLERIPRLEAVSAMVGGQRDVLSPAAMSRAWQEDDRVNIGRMLLRTTADFDDLMQSQVNASEAAFRLGSDSRKHPQRVIDVLASSNLGPVQQATHTAVLRAFSDRTIRTQHGSNDLKSWFDNDGAM